MTTIAEELTQIQTQITSLAKAVIGSRVKVLEMLELAEALLARPSGAGLTSPYDTHCQFYGKQRSVLYGLAASDCAFHTINGTAVWNTAPSITFPSAAAFAYEVLDDSGGLISFSSPSLYYLTLDLRTGALSDIAQDPGAFITPTSLPQVQESLGVGNIGGSTTAWQAVHAYLVGDLIIPTSPNGYYYRCTGAGTSGASAPAFPVTVGDTVADNTVTWTCVNRVPASWVTATSYSYGDVVVPSTPNGYVFQCVQAGISSGSEPTWPSSGNTIVDGTVVWLNSASVVFSKTLTNIPVAGTVKVLINNAIIGADDGAGNITGTGIYAGTVDYVTGAISVSFNPPQFSGNQLAIQYEGIAGLSDWQEKYMEVSFTLSTSTYGPAGIYTLYKLTIAAPAAWAATTLYTLQGKVLASPTNGYVFQCVQAGTSGGTQPTWDLTVGNTTTDGTVIWKNMGLWLVVAPTIMQRMNVRLKADKTKFGNLFVLTEGLKPNFSWDPLTGAAADCMEVTDADFQNLLGFANPVTPDDVYKSADPANVSNGALVGSAYPNIALNPFFPATDGNYSGNSPYTGGWNHIESGVSKWKVFPGIRFLYGTQPVGGSGDLNNPPLQQNPGTVLSGLTAIGTIGASPAGTNPVPADVPSGSGGTHYSFNQKDSGSGTYASPAYVSTGDNLVYANVYDSSGVWVSSTAFSCLWNTLQTFLAQANGGTFLNTQMVAINTLTDFQNTIDPSRWGSGSGVDPTFFNASATFKTALQAWITYHSTTYANPVTERPTSYALTTWNALVTAASTYLSLVSARITDLDTVLGTDFSAGYTGKLYATCNLATNTQIGWLAFILQQLRSTANLLTQITQQQANYVAINTA